VKSENPRDASLGEMSVPRVLSFILQ